MYTCPAVIISIESFGRRILKHLAIILILALVLTASGACGKNKDEAAPGTNTQTQQATQFTSPAATRFSFTVDGMEWANFTETKRNGYNYFIMSEADADQQTLVTASDWIEVKTNP